MVATGEQVAEGQTITINGNEATLHVPEGCIYCMKVVPLYDENMPQLQRISLCRSLLELLWECILNSSASAMADA